MVLTQKALIEWRSPWGFPIQVKQSALWFCILLIVAGGFDGSGWTMQFLALLFLATFVHEVGHAIAARWQNLPVKAIELNFGGGACIFTSEPNSRAYVMAVLGGPVMNLLVFVASLIALALSPDPQAQVALTIFTALNLILGLGNLAPVFPMDGGRMLFAGLIRILPFTLALRLMGAVGLVLVILWILGFVGWYLTGAHLLALLPAALAVPLLWSQALLIRGQSPFPG